MSENNSTPPTGKRLPPYTLPQWERPDGNRRRLNQRVQSVRGVLLGGSAVGTVVFSAVAGYESTSPIEADSVTEAATEVTGQMVGAIFFAGQSSIRLETPTVAASESASVQTTPSSFATTAPKASTELADVPDPVRSAPPANPPPGSETGTAPFASSNPPPGNATQSAPPPPPPPPDASTHPTN